MNISELKAIIEHPENYVVFFSQAGISGGYFTAMEWLKRVLANDIALPSSAFEKMPEGFAVSRTDDGDIIVHSDDGWRHVVVRGANYDEQLKRAAACCYAVAAASGGLDGRDR